MEALRLLLLLAAAGVSETTAMREPRHASGHTREAALQIRTIVTRPCTPRLRALHLCVPPRPFTKTSTIGERIDATIAEMTGAMTAMATEMRSKTVTAFARPNAMRIPMLKRGDSASEPPVLVGQAVSVLVTILTTQLAMRFSTGGTPLLLSPLHQFRPILPPMPESLYQMLVIISRILLAQRVGSLNATPGTTGTMSGIAPTTGTAIAIGIDPKAMTESATAKETARIAVMIVVRTVATETAIFRVLYQLLLRLLEPRMVLNIWLKVLRYVTSENASENTEAIPMKKRSGALVRLRHLTTARRLVSDTTSTKMT